MQSENSTPRIIRKIAVIEVSYIRDAQIYTADPDDFDGEDGFADLKYPCHYVGIFEGADDDEIRQKAAGNAGVHPGVITLIDIPPSVV
jgi:hypothetical protein